MTGSKNNSPVPAAVFADARAFPGEVDAGSPQKMRSNKENESEFRFNQIGIRSSNAELRLIADDHRVF
jgi:hypothetical protein